MPLPDESAAAEHSVSHYKLWDYSHIFKIITVVIEKRPGRESLNLWDHIRRLEEFKGTKSVLPTTAKALRYDVGNWLGHFHNWGSEEKVVQKLRGIMGVPWIMASHRRYITTQLEKALHRLPKHSEQILSQVHGFIKAKSLINPGNTQIFKIIQGRFELENLHIVIPPSDKRVNPVQVPSVCISEWRGCYEGDPMFDFGRLMADLVVLFQQNITVADEVAQGFIRGYFAKAKNSHRSEKEFMCHVLVYTGVFVIIRSLQVCEKKTHAKKNDGTGKDQNNGKHNNTANENSSNISKDNNGTGNENGNGIGGHTSDPKHVNNEDTDGRIFEYALQIMQHALHEDCEWFLDKPVLRHLFEESAPKGHSRPGR